MRRHPSSARPAERARLRRLLFTTSRPRGLLLAATLVAVAGCSSGGGEEPVGASPGGTAILSPANGATVAHERLVLEVQADAGTLVRVTNESLDLAGTALSPAVLGIAGPASALVWDVPLAPGPNQLRVDAEVDGAFETLGTLGVQLVPGSAGPPATTVEPRWVEASGGPARLTLADGAWVEALVDLDADGVVDVTTTAAETFELEPVAGSLVPRVAFRDAGGVLIPNRVSSRSVAVLVDDSTSTPAPDEFAAGTDLLDLERDAFETGFTALGGQGQVLRFDPTGNLVQTSPSAGWTEGGIGLDASGRVFVADRFGARIWRLDPELGYAPDPAFGNAGQLGSPGTQPAKFDQPLDVTVAAIGGLERVFVVDSGNRRIQRFSLSGTFEAQFDLGELDPPEALVDPRRIQTVDFHTLAILEPDAVRIVRTDGSPVAQVAVGDHASAGASWLDLASGADGGLWALATDGTAVALASDGRLLRRTFLGEGFAQAALVELRRAPSWRLFVSSSAGARAVDLAEDALGSAPDAVAQGFLDAVAAGEESAALAAAAPGLHSLVQVMLGDADGRAALAALELDVDLIGRSEATAVVRARSTAGPTAQSFELALLLDPDRLRWLVSEL